MRSRVALPGALLALVLAVWIALPAVAAPGVDKVDSWIRSGTTKKVGLGIVNADGTNQTKTRRITAGATVTYTIGAIRHGSGTGTIEFVGGAGAPNFEVTYLLTDGTDITTDITGRGYTFRGVSDGQTVRVILKVDTTQAADQTSIFAVLARTPDRSDMVIGRIVIR
ncbi:MAG: hypothetical protein ABI572_03170 [Actinomycetota bacterium]